MPLAAAIAIVAFLVHEISSLDVWWQVTIGGDILERLAIPAEDRFSVAGWGRPYHDSHWLFQAVLALAHRVLGMGGVELVMIALWGLTLTLCYRSCRRQTGPVPAAVLVFFAAMASMERFLPRPEIVTFLCVATFLHLLLGGRFRSRRELAVLALVQVLWANSHGLFVLGPFLVGCWWLTVIAGHFARKRRPRAGAGEDPSTLPALTRALAVTGAATLATPFGFGGWRYAWVLFAEAGGGGPVVMESLGELSATFGAAARSAPAFWFFLALLTASTLAALLALARRRVSPLLLAVAGLAATAFTGRRNVVLFVLAAAPFLAGELARILPRSAGGGEDGAQATPQGARSAFEHHPQHSPAGPPSAWRIPRWAAAAAALLMTAWALYPLSGAYYVRMEIPARFGFGVTPSFFPHGLPAFLDRIGFEGRVLNSNTLGGFYLYHGYPRRLPLTDGRWEVYDPQVLERVLALSRDPGSSGWRILVAEYDLGGILLAHTSPEARALVPALSRAGDWRLVYYDTAASFWMPEGPAVPPAVNAADPTRLPPLERVDDGLLLNAFLGLVGATEARRINLERTLDFGVRREMLLEQLGPLQIAAGRLEEAEETFGALLAEDPDSVAALNELAFLAYNRGDLEHAAALLERALAADPENQRLRQNLERLRAAQGSGPGASKKDR